MNLNPFRRRRLTSAEGAVDHIVRDRFFPNHPAGVLVEVGAARPDYLSISALYRSLGWQVVAIDPNPVYAEQYRDLGYELLQYACADHDEDDVEFTMVDSHGNKYLDGEVTFESISSLGVRGGFAELWPNVDSSTIKVNVRRLDRILTEHAASVDHVNILVADVEGWEIEVLSGLDFAKYQPDVVIIENIFLLDSYRQFMRARGYTLWRFVTPNEVWIKQGMAGGAEMAVNTLRTTAVTAYERMKLKVKRLRVPQTADKADE